MTKKELKIIGEKIGVDWNKYNIDEALKGYQVELEHGTKGNWNITNNNPEMTLKIALVHLDEGNKYYKYLDILEKKLKAPKQKNEVKSFIKNTIREILKNK